MARDSVGNTEQPMGALGRCGPRELLRRPYGTLAELLYSRGVWMVTQVETRL